MRPQVLFSSQDVLHRVLPSAAARLCLTLWFYADPDAPAPATGGFGGAGLDEEAVSTAPMPAALWTLLGPQTRHHLARWAHAKAWAVSISESHAPSPGREAAIQTHWHDVAHIEQQLLAALMAAGEDDGVVALAAVRAAVPLHGGPAAYDQRLSWFD